jgi:hypothetical protein
VGDDNEGQYKLEVRVVEIFQLIPVTHTIKNSTEKSLLYNQEVIKNLFKILSIDSSEEDSNLVILHSQVQIIKVITSLVESEYKSLGTHSDFLNFLTEQSMLIKLFAFLQRNAGKPQLLQKNELNLPTELLELTLTQIRLKTMENQVCLLKSN